MQRCTILPTPAPLVTSFFLGSSCRFIWQNNGCHLHRWPRLCIYCWHLREKWHLLSSLAIRTLPEPPSLDLRLSLPAFVNASKHNIAKVLSDLAVHSATSTFSCPTTHATSDFFPVLPTRSSYIWYVGSNQAAVRPPEEMAVRAGIETSVNFCAHEECSAGLTKSVESRLV